MGLRHSALLVRCFNRSRCRVSVRENYTLETATYMPSFFNVGPKVVHRWSRGLSRSLSSGLQNGRGASKWHATPVEKTQYLSPAKPTRSASWDWRRGLETAKAPGGVDAVFSFFIQPFRCRLNYDGGCTILRRITYVRWFLEAGAINGKSSLETKMSSDNEGKWKAVALLFLNKTRRLL